MKTIDLAYPIHKGMFKYPSDPEVKISVKKSDIIEEDKVIYDESGQGSGAGITDRIYKSGNLTLELMNHHGTHIDAPSHKIKGGKEINYYDFDKFINQAIIIDLTKTDILTRKEKEIKKEDIKDKIWLDKLTEGIIIYTGFCDEMFKNEGRIFGKDKLDFEKDFPYFSQESAIYITEKCPRLNIIGIDSFAVDKKGSNSEVHRIFFKKDILPLETLVNLSKLRGSQNKSFQLNSVPMPYANSDAAQTRAYAIVD